MKEIKGIICNYARRGFYKMDVIYYSSCPNLLTVEIKHTDTKLEIPKELEGDLLHFLTEIGHCGASSFEYPNGDFDYTYHCCLYNV